MDPKQEKYTLIVIKQPIMNLYGLEIAKRN